MMEAGDIGIKDVDDLAQAMDEEPCARMLYETYGDRIGGMIAYLLDETWKIAYAKTLKPAQEYQCEPPKGKPDLPSHFKLRDDGRAECWYCADRSLKGRDPEEWASYHDCKRKT